VALITVSSWPELAPARPVARWACPSSISSQAACPLTSPSLVP
jgi:hypothetical protein